jgi:hypothetical protein
MFIEMLAREHPCSRGIQCEPEPLRAEYLYVMTTLSTGDPSYEGLYPERIDRFRKCQEGREPLDPQTKNTSWIWGHQLHHEAESIFWLVLLGGARQALGSRGKIFQGYAYGQAWEILMAGSTSCKVDFMVRSSTMPIVLWSRSSTRCAPP